MKPVAQISTGKRNEVIDLIKALGIIFMVLGHSGAPISQFIYLFHMAIFFIASGYCYKPAYSEDIPSVLTFIKKKFKSLWFPYVLWITIFTVLHNVFIKINVYTDNPLINLYVSGEWNCLTSPWSIGDMIRNIIFAILLHGGAQIGGAFWFLATLFEISIAYCLIDFFINLWFKKQHRNLLQGCVAVVFVLLGYLCSIYDISLFGIDRILSFYILFYFGNMISHFQLSDRPRTTAGHGIFLLVSFIILLILNELGTIRIDINRYENPLFLIAASCTGWQFMYEISFFLKRFKPVCTMLSCIGKNTLAVVILHLLCFKSVSYIGVLLNGDPAFLVAAFPYLYEGTGWWIAYSLAGIGIPVVLSLLWKKLKSSCFFDCSQL